VIVSIIVQMSPGPADLNATAQTHRTEGNKDRTALSLPLCVGRHADRHLPSSSVTADVVASGKAGMMAAWYQQVTAQQRLVTHSVDNTVQPARQSAGTRHTTAACLCTSPSWNSAGWS